MQLNDFTRLCPLRPAVRHCQTYEVAAQVLNFGPGRRCRVDVSLCEPGELYLVTGKARCALTASVDGAFVCLDLHTNIQSFLIYFLTS